MWCWDKRLLNREDCTTVNLLTLKKTIFNPYKPALIAQTSFSLSCKWTLHQLCFLWDAGSWAASRASPLVLNSVWNGNHFVKKYSRRCIKYCRNCLAGCYLCYIWHLRETIAFSSFCLHRNSMVAQTLCSLHWDFLFIWFKAIPSIRTSLMVYKNSPLTLHILRYSCLVP